MKVSGSHVLHGSPQQVWDALQDPAVLVRTIPGCHSLEQIEDHTWTATVHAGVASIKGTYEGRVSLSDQDPPNSYVLKASGSGGPGTIDATATVRLVEDDGATTVRYDADAIVGGAVGGVGQRVLSGVAKRNASAFFTAVDLYLAGDLKTAEAAAPDVAGEAVDGGQMQRAGSQQAAGSRVFERPQPVSAGGMSEAPGPLQLLLAALVGAAIALAGVLIGRRAAR